MSRYTKEDIFRMVEEEDVKFIRLQFTDMFGMLKNIAITDGQLSKALNNCCVFDGSAIEGFVRLEESDMYLHPDLDTFEIFPWRPQQGKVARLICDVYRQDGTPFEGDPRYILKKVLKVDEEGKPTTKTQEMAGYFDVAPIDQGENVRRDIVLNLEQMGFDIASSYHEVAPAQHEVDFEYVPGLWAADDILTFQMAVKTIARRHGFHATFMPKPIAGVNGSGMHLNMSLADLQGNNLFYDGEDERGLSAVAYQFMAGILAHVKSMTLLTNPLVNSYKRLIPGYDAPVHIAWSTATNRGQLLRIPGSRGDRTRLELRSPDSGMNPYLALAACLAAGLDGIKKKMTPPPAVEKNVFAMSEEEAKAAGIERLPETLGQAIFEFERDGLWKEVLGAYLYDKYLEAKKEEWNEFRRQVTDWEVEQYLYKF